MDLDFQPLYNLHIGLNGRKAVYQGIQRNWVDLFYSETNIQPHGLANIKLQFPD